MLMKSNSSRISKDSVISCEVKSVASQVKRDNSLVSGAVPQFSTISRDLVSMALSERSDSDMFDGKCVTARVWMWTQSAVASVGSIWF